MPENKARARPLGQPVPLQLPDTDNKCAPTFTWIYTFKKLPIMKGLKINEGKQFSACSLCSLQN